MEMSGTDISNLSYKELQALALRYRVPGNIKKQLLIEVLQAARCGNEQEVDKLLSDLRQNRKKRIRRGKPAKLNLSSTPIHSPTYDMADDNYYNAQHRLPYQWVGAEEEIPNRQDDPNRIPQYEEFRQFLLRRIQRDYQTYSGNNIERVDPGDPGGPGGLTDLRNESDSIRFDPEQVGMRSSTVPTNGGLESAQSYSEQLQAHNGGGFDYQILEDPNENGHASILLRRMLQAPAGADLGEIASPEMARSCRIWQAEYQQGQNNILDNSDTLSANSEVNDNEETWPNGAEYYRFVNNVRDQLILNPTSAPVACSRTFYDQSTTTTTEQFSGVVNAEGNPVEYQIVYANQIPDVQQPWEAANPVDNASAYETEQQALTQYQSLKSYAASYTTPQPLETDPLQLAYPGGEDAATAGVVYPRNENGLEDQPVDDCNPSTGSRTEIRFYQNLNSAATGRQLDDANCNFNFARSSIIPTSNHNAGIDQTLQPTAGFMPPMQHLSFSSTPQIAEHEFNRPSVLMGQYDNRQEHNTLMMQKLNAVVDGQEFSEGEPRNLNRNKTATNATIEPNGTPWSLDPFWPQRSASKNVGDSKQLENILNLKAYGYVDYSKIDQTSCIYCYAAPIVTQRTFSGSSSCSQKRRFIAEFRQHTFSPYWLLYSDAKTGMQMSKHVKVIDKTTERQEAEQLRTVTLDFEGPQNAQLHNIVDDSPFQVEGQQLPAELIAGENSIARIDPEFCSLAPTDERFAPVAGSDTNDGEKTQALIIDSEKGATATTENENRFDQNGNCNLVTGI